MVGLSAALALGCLPAFAVNSIKPLKISEVPFLPPTEIPRVLDIGSQEQDGALLHQADEKNPIARQVQALERLSEVLSPKVKAAAEGNDPRSSGKDIEQELTGERSSRGPGAPDNTSRPGIAHPLGFFVDAYGRAVAKANALGVAKEQVTFTWAAHDSVANPNSKGWAVYFAFVEKNRKEQATHLYAVSYEESSNPPKDQKAAISDDLPLAGYYDVLEDGRHALGLHRPFVALYKVDDSLNPSALHVSMPLHINAASFSGEVKVGPNEALDLARRKGLQEDLVGIYLDMLDNSKFPWKRFWYHILTVDQPGNASGVCIVNAYTGDVRWLKPKRRSLKEAFGRIWAKLRPAIK